MKQKFFIFGLILMFISSCSGYGEVIKFGESEIYYDSTVSKDEVKKLGNYLSEKGFFKNGKKSLKLTKLDDIYELKMVVKPELYEDEDFMKEAEKIAENIAVNVFNGSMLELQFTDQYFAYKNFVSYDG